MTMIVMFELKGIWCVYVYECLWIYLYMYVSVFKNRRL